MSFILDALRKSESRRQHSGVPGLNSPEPPGSPHRRRARRWPWLIGGGLVLVVIVAGALHFSGLAQLPTPEPDEREAAVSPEPAAAESEQTTAQPAPDSPQARLGESKPDETTVDQRRRRRRQPPREAASVSEEKSQQEETSPTQRRADRRRRRVPPGAAEASPGEARQRESSPLPAEEATRKLERRLAEREQQGPEDGSPQPPAHAQQPEDDATASSPDKPAQPEPDATTEAALNEGVAEYLRAWELPLSTRRSLPELDLTIHVYSPEETERFVLLNGERHVAGDSIGDARIVEITRDGAVLDFRSHRFLLEPR